MHKKEISHADHNLKNKRFGYQKQILKYMGSCLKLKTSQNELIIYVNVLTEQFWEQTKNLAYEPSQESDANTIINLLV